MNDDEFSFCDINLRQAKCVAQLFHDAGFTEIHLTQCKTCRRWTVYAAGDELQAAKLLAYELGSESAMRAIKEIRKERKRNNWRRRHKIHK